MASRYGTLLRTLAGGSRIARRPLSGSCIKAGAPSAMMAGRYQSVLRLKEESWRLRSSPARFMGGGVHTWKSPTGEVFYMNPLEAEERIILVLNSFENVKDKRLIHGKATFKEMGLDSLDNVELLFALEEEFSFEMTDEQADKITSVPEMVDFVINHPYAKSLDYDEEH